MGGLDLGNIAGVVTAAAAVVALIGGYVQFVLRRALLPCIEFDVEFTAFSCSTPDQLVGEILCKIRNEGPAVGYVTRVRCNVSYRLVGESGQRSGEPLFVHKVLPRKKFISLENQKRFIQPRVTQWYRKPLAFPASTSLIHVRGQFEYELTPGKVAEALAKFFRQPYEKGPAPYIVRRTFAIGEAPRHTGK